MDDMKNRGISFLATADFQRIDDNREIDGIEASRGDLYRNWDGQISVNEFSFPIARLLVTPLGTCDFYYKIETNRRDIITRIDLRFSDSNGFILLDNLSFDPSRYKGPGVWDQQTKNRTWFEVRQDFPIIARASCSVYYESSYD